MDGFVEVLVEATGRTELVPAHFLDDEVLGQGITLVKPGAAPPVAAPASPESDVALVAGTESDLPWNPAAAEAVLAARAAGVAVSELPTEKSTHAELDDFAAKADPPIALTGASTKAEKLALIEAALSNQDPDDIESSDETPAAGEEEN